jgi:hypothetical protein
MRFGLYTLNLHRFLTDDLRWQLCQCRLDEARRLILGVSERMKEESL